MSRHDDEVRLRHVLDAARKAVALTAGRTRVQLEADEIAQLALARLLEIVGEAAGNSMTRRHSATTGGDQTGSNPSRRRARVTGPARARRGRRTPLVRSRARGETRKGPRFRGRMREGPAGVTGGAFREPTDVSCAFGARTPLVHRDQARSKRSAFMTLLHAFTKSCTNFSLLSSCA